MILLLCCACCANYLLLRRHSTAYHPCVPRLATALPTTALCAFLLALQEVDDVCFGSVFPSTSKRASEVMGGCRAGSKAVSVLLLTGVLCDRRPASSKCEELRGARESTAFCYGLRPALIAS